MPHHLKIEPLTAEEFAPFGDVLQVSGTADKMINQGKCGRYHDLAQLDFTDGEAGISIFNSEVEKLPLRLRMVERHPFGSQAFISLSGDPFLVVVAQDDGGVPVNPRAFITSGGQAINFHKGTWHGVLTPLNGPGLFAVIDRIGQGVNLEEHWFTQTYVIEE